MSFLHRITMAALVALLTLPAVSFAQTTAPAKLVSGTWTGAITTPGNPTPTDIEYEVVYKEDALAITLVVAGRERFPLEDIEVSDGKISFSFRPGPHVVCVLKHGEAAYAGECTDGEGGVAPLTMVPPVAEPKK